MLKRKLRKHIREAHERRDIVDGEYLVNRCQGFGASDEVHNLYDDLRLMLKNTRKIEDPDKALYLLQSIRDTCQDMAKLATEIIDGGSR